ncbi:MAG: hypothetical protein WA919_01145 [Coleofasciculaceae cyanobacterium]
MTSPKPLKGTDLVDCARANVKQGVETSAKLCGYGEDIESFRQELDIACQQMGVQISDLVPPDSSPLKTDGRVIAPDTPSEL